MRAPGRALGIVLAAAVACPAAAAAPRRVPAGWLGVTVNGPALSVGVDLGGEGDAMARAGAESIRAAVTWDQAQPFASFAAVPPGERPRFRSLAGVPTDVRDLDRLVGVAAARRLRVLVVVTGGTPAWAGPSPSAPPRHLGDYARLVRGLVQRYGPTGAFWNEHPELPRAPVRQWQLWNEVELPQSWSRQPFAPSYVALLRAGRAGARQVDPRAQIVAAGLTNFSWQDLDAIYRAGGRGAFDAAAIHPYTFDARNVPRIVGLARAVMRRHGDGGKPLLVTELSWFSSRAQLGPRQLLSVTEADQAANLRRAVTALARDRVREGIAGVYWYTWLSPPLGSSSVFDYAGLRRLEGDAPVDKPALAAYRDVARRLEGCAKTAVATRCAPG
jgi:hypothetical protein